MNINICFQRNINVIYAFIISFLFQCHDCSCQKFYSVNNYVEIPDFNNVGSHLDVEIGVNGLPRKINSRFGLEKVQLAVQHSRISDIKIVLVSPDGLEVWLTNRHGRNGANYTETIFSNSGFRGRISDGSPPFLGEYLPDGVLSNFNNGQNPNGIWKLKVYDLDKGVIGKFGSVVLYFSNTPASSKVSKCSSSTPESCKCENVKKKKSCELLPDLTLIKEITEKEIYEIPFNEKLGYGELRFGVSTFNKGLGPLEVRGNNIWMCKQDTVDINQLCQDGSYPRQEVFQYIYFKEKNKLSSRIKPAGYNAYDARPGHEHFHSDDYVNYELLIPSSKDTSEWEVACKGTKASFCIWDLNFCRNDLKNCKDVNGRLYLINDLPNYGFKGYKDCLPEVQGLSVGGVDYYGEGFEGQSITFPKGFKNGHYFLKIEIDPLNLFEESDENNNSFIIPVTIRNQNK